MVWKPEDGSHFSLTENRMISIMPDQNTGSDMPIKANTIKKLSKKEYWRVAETIPMGNPTRMANRIAASANRTVAGKALTILSVTGVRVS